MSKPRYDEEEDKSRHAATDEERCHKMAQKYSWELVRVEMTPENPTFKVDCVFEGETEFPQSFHDTEED